MKCFYHPDVDAIGICKNCGRGICRECAVEIGNALACKGTCEAVLKSTAGKSKIVDPEGNVVYTGKIYLFATKFRFRTALWLIMGVVLFGTGVVNGDPSGLLTLAGILFVLFGLFIFMRGRKAEKAKI